MSNYRMGVDIGGTFTDLVMMDDQSGALRVVKLSSTPQDPSIAFLEIVNRVLRESAEPPASVGYLVHGTTVATNTIIEGKGAKAALLTTDGFRDVLEIARQIRPRLYDLFCEKPRPLVPRQLCRGVPERLNFAGEVLEPLDQQTVRRVAKELADAAVESIAVCLLHSYRNAAHERQIKQILSELLPNISVSLSSELCPEMREYFRASTTVINAILMPVVGRYLARLQSRLSEIGMGAGLHLMTSAGGTVSADVAASQPVQLIESGPAAGVIAATYIGRQVEIDNLISFDMGGTTAKVGLVENGVPKISPHFEVGAAAVTDNKSAGYPVRTPVVDLVEIGAGGGSIAWVDPGGALRVGPQSGGADPGPACYGKGQTEPTITDANLVLGRLNPDYFIGGEKPLDQGLAEKAVQTIADQLGMPLVEAANGIVQIANAKMLAAIRLISVQRGFDPREFVLVAFGGAGPLHAGALATGMGMAKVLIPMSPGVTSALGLLVSDIRHDFVQTSIGATANIKWTVLNRIFNELREKAREVMATEGIAETDQSFDHFLDMRYIGQSYELKVAVPQRTLEQADAAELNQRFYQEHERAYGYSTSDQPTEIVNVRISAIGSISRPQLRVFEEGGLDSSAARKNRRQVYFPEAKKTLPCEVYDRYQLKYGNRIAGPAIVEEIDSTVLIHPGSHADVDRFGNLVIETGAEA
ncbi:MAG: hydantoinase/oxoprolinase family protein [Pirellulales bacterium]|nr:hydantoinase/oxoprolinase family protein [Pirellulales bacterium]